MRTTTYLNFNGECEEAFAFYAEVFGGTIGSMMHWSDVPGMDVPDDRAQRVMHAELKLGNHEILGADALPDAHVAPQGFNVTVNVDSSEEAERLFGALGEGGKVTMPMSETFFAQRFGMVTDRFGTPWMIVFQES